MDTAAIMRNVDLVISVDTASAHLAGALGVPVWLVLSYSSDWRWGLSGSTNPWYPATRLFREPTPGDREGALGELAAALDERLRGAVRVPADTTSATPATAR
jgi:ADP-heptose:LPS heptosyltransferase